MKFRAIEMGVLVSGRVYPGQEFEADEDFSASWAEPVDAVAVVEEAEPEESPSPEEPEEAEDDDAEESEE